MIDLSRRDFAVSTALAVALGFGGRRLVAPAIAQSPPAPAKGFHKYKVGSVEVTALYDGIWKKPHDPAFIKNAGIDETKDALAKAGMTTDYMPIPLTALVLKIGDKLDMIDSGSAVDKTQPTAGSLPANPKRG